MVGFGRVVVWVRRVVMGVERVVVGVWEACSVGLAEL